ncbi:MAG: phytanoyl-CoA dioxygenase family protein [Flavobacteriales bacterium]
MTYSSIQQEFATQGYTIVRNVIPMDEVKRFRTVFENMQRREESVEYLSSKEMMITHLLDEVTELQGYLFSGKVHSVMTELLGKSIWCLPESLLHCNRYFDWHKDSTVMDLHAINYHQMTGSTIVQLGLYFQDNAISGGGLYLTAGSHLRPDRFAFPDNLGRIKRIRRKLCGNSLNSQIERIESPIAPDVKAGDVILFDFRLDHRASFMRNIWGKPIRLKNQKYAVFSQFANDELVLRHYLDAIRRNPGPYSEFLRNYRLPETLKSVLNHQSLKAVLA